MQPVGVGAVTEGVAEPGPPLPQRGPLGARVAGGITMIVSTHDLNFAASVCSSLVLLREGRIVAAGSTREVLTSANVRLLYGVHADVTRHAAAGHLIVVPISLAEGSEGA